MSVIQKKVSGILASFASPQELLAAAEKLRDAGYKNFDCHSPFPIHGMDQAMGLKRSPIGFIVGVAAMLALSGATLMMWWMSAVDYPLRISGKPYFSFQAYVPVAFALTILTSAITAVVAMLALNRFPWLHHPLFATTKFHKTTDDGFFVSVESTDAKFDEDHTKSFLQSIGGTDLEIIRP